MGDRVRALSVRQPWAHAILHLGKDVENRSRRTRYRGPVLIQVALRVDRVDAENLDLDADKLKRGVILGVVDIVDCVRNHRSKWADKGAWHWVLANPRAFRTPSSAREHSGFFVPRREVYAS